MKKLLLFFILLSFCTKTKAQVTFCPPGAKWSYAFIWPLNNWYTENFSIVYNKDTIIGTETIKVLTPAKFYKRQNCRYASRTLIRQRGDTIFMNNDKTQHTWQILYNFAALAGHSWETTFLDAKNVQVTYTISVDSATTVSIHNFPLKKLHVKYWTVGANGPYSEAANITERLGCNIYFFNYSTQNCVSDADRFDKFLCYQDNEFGIKQLTDTACNFTDAVGINEWLNYEFTIHTYPNPVSDVLNIEITGIVSNEIEFILHDLQGRELIKTTISQKDKIDLSGLSKGLYFFTITKNKEPIFKEKLIKE